MAAEGNSELDGIERIFQDIRNHSQNVDKNLEILNIGDVNHELQLQKHKNHLASLKTILIRLQTQSRFLEMARENWSSASDLEMTEHQSNVRSENKQDKVMIEELETQIDDMAETLSTKHKILKEKLDLLENRLVSTKDKRKNFEMLKEKLEEMGNKVQEKENSHGSLEDVKAKQAEAELAIQQCTAAISGLEHCKGLLKGEVSRLEEFVKEREEELKRQTEMTKDHDEQERKRRQWLTDVVELHSRLGGVSVQSLHGDCVVLEIRSDEHIEDQGGEVIGRTASPLILTIKYRLDGGTRPVFGGATVNLDSLSIDDLVDEAVLSNDVAGFVFQVKRRFKNQQGLIREVEELQTNYAIDWEPSHRRIRVMLGKSGKIVCILKVDPLYSSGQGHVHLLGVEGGSYHKEIQHLQSTGSGRNLTQVIKDLQELFINQ
ncbi:tropomyosin [Pocillopora verrucosa]|uniref:tropomyosin n=1 Tax=Pocillopora verrucosa TaxID=203993 RepID=UPI0033421BF8